MYRNETREVELVEQLAEPGSPDLRALTVVSSVTLSTSCPVLGTNLTT